ncbi:MAG: EamA family transporter [Bacteroidota bacterium]|nr:EamA family transporter [Bacteroidota bacterium]
MSSTIFFWATAYIGNRMALNSYEPGELALFRYLVASIFLTLIPVFGLLKIKNPPQSKHIIHFALLGLFGISLYNIFLYNGQLTIKPGLASLLTNTAPIFTAAMSVIFLKEKVNFIGWTCIFISFIGVCIIVLGNTTNFQFEIGMIWVLLAAISLSLYFIIQKPVLTHYQGFEITYFSILAGTILLIPFGLNLPISIIEANYKNTLSVVYLGIFPGAIAYFTWSMVNSILPTSKSSIFLYLIPVISFMLSYFVFNEKPSIYTIIGGIFVLIGIFTFNFFVRKN